MPTTELDTIIVHSDEAGSMRWNALTHGYKITELNTDGDVMIDVRPLGEVLPAAETDDGN